MRYPASLPVLSALGVATLVLSACGGDASATDEPEPTTSASEEVEDTATVAEPDEDLEQWEDTSEPAEDRVFRPSQQIIGTESGVEFNYLSAQEGAGVEVHHLHCEDPDALAEKAAHNGDSQPVGWPQDWDGTGDMPDPYCHPDYLEVGEWENLESHSACWEGIETSTLGDDGQPQAEIDNFLWEQSQARADWSPNPPGGTCAEQWAEHHGGDPEDYADVGNAEDGGHS